MSSGISSGCASAGRASGHSTWTTSPARGVWVGLVGLPFDRDVAFRNEPLNRPARRRRELAAQKCVKPFARERFLYGEGSFRADIVESMNRSNASTF